MSWGGGWPSEVAGDDDITARKVRGGGRGRNPSKTRNGDRGVLRRGIITIIEVNIVVMVLEGVGNDK